MTRRADRTPFARLAEDRVPETLLARLSRDVTRATAGLAPQRELRRRRAAGIAAVAASLLLALLLGVRPEGERPPVVALEAAAPPPVAAPGGAPLPETTARVLEMTVGETQLVMIFDEALEL